MADKRSADKLCWLLPALLLACSPDSIPDSAKAVPPVESTAHAGFVEASWKAPTEADIPNDPLGQSIERGLYLLRFTPESLPDYARFPKFLPRTGADGLPAMREERAASFIFHNMPLTNPRALTAQESFDLAAFINAHPRPDSPGKEHDWPAGGAPKDVPYATAGHLPYRAPSSLIPRKHPNRALVPKPASVVSNGSQD